VTTEVTTQADAETAGVPFPPPLIYLAVIGVGLVTERFFPGPALPEGARWLGVVVILGALALAALAAREMRRAGTAIRPDVASTSLVTAGPFGRSRNPIYLALALAQIGLGLGFSSLWTAALTPVAMALVIRIVIRREESYLASRFGRSYSDYRARVRRWL